MLFARGRSTDRSFYFLGPARYVSHESELPMAITWQLEHSLPGDLFASFAAAVAQLLEEPRRRFESWGQVSGVVVAANRVQGRLRARALHGRPASIGRRASNAALLRWRAQVSQKRLALA
jgi:hypothetical protein